MLTITRKRGESIIIEVGEEKIEVVVSSFRDRSVRLAINASDNINILRKELLENEKNDKNSLK